MGRLTINTENSYSNDISELSTKTYGIYNFIDENGNISQVPREEQTRLKYYPDALTIQDFLNEPIVIGVSDDVPMGTGEINSSTEMAYAVY